MRRIRIRDGEALLSYMLEPRYNRIGRMKNKIASIGKTILGFFDAWKQDHKPHQQSHADNNVDGGFKVVQNENQAVSNRKGQRVLEKAAQKRASRLIKYCDISSSEDQQDLPQFVVNQEPEEAHFVKRNEPKPQIVLKEQQRTVQALIQYRINAIKNKLKISKPEEKNQQQASMGPEITFSKEKSAEDIQELKAKKRSRTNYESEKNAYEQYEVKCIGQQQEQSGQSMPRKRINTISYGYLGYVKKYSNAKMEAYKQIQRTVPKMAKEYNKFIQKEYAPQHIQSESEDDFEKLEEEKSLNTHLQSLVSTLDKIKQRKANNLSADNKSEQFKPAENSIKAKKFKVDIEKVLAIAKQPQPVVQEPTPVFPPAKEPTAHMNNSFSFMSNSSKSFSLSGGMNFSQPLFGVKSVQNKKQIKPDIKLFSNEVQKQSQQQPANKLQPQLKPLSNKSQSPFMLNMNKKQNQSQQPAQKINLFGIFNKKSQAKQISKEQVSKEQKKEDPPKLIFGEPKKQDELVKKDSASEAKSSSPAKFENPFLNKPQPNRNLLPELIGSNTATVFSNSTISKENLFTIFQKKPPLIPYSAVPAEATTTNDNQKEKEKQKEPEKVNMFSTPTKNIYEKYPDLQPKADMQPKAQLGELPQQQSSMFDESEHDKSFSKIDQGSQKSQGQPLFGFGNAINNVVGLDVQKQQFLSSIPNIDPSKSLELFGKSLSNQPLNLFAPSSSEKKKDSKSVHNKKKPKQQRAYS